MVGYSASLGRPAAGALNQKRACQPPAARPGPKAAASGPLPGHPQLEVRAPVLFPLQGSSRVAMKAVAGDSLTMADSSLAKATYAAELSAAVEAVQLASQLCQTVQQQLSAAEKADKDDDSPVTVADYGAQALVAWALSRAFPDVPLSLVAEEDSSDLRAPEGAAMLGRITRLINEVLAGVAGAAPLTEQQVIDLIDLGGSEGGSQGRHWVLDPIDGTRGFVGQRQYAVCLGMLQEGEVALGVLGCPNLPQGTVTDDDGKAGASGRSEEDGVGVMFLAHRGAGAYSTRLWGEGSSSSSRPLHRIHVKDTRQLEEARFMESYESRHSNHSLTAQVANEMGIVLPPLRMDSQVKYGLLSRGDASIFMRFPPATYREKIWDHCAGFVIVEEAGGKVTDGSGARLDFSRGRWLDLDRGIIAAPPNVHEKLLAALHKVQSSSS